MDYSIWAEIERRLREQESRMPASKRETRQQFEKRLDRTAMSLPSSYIKNTIDDLHKRFQKLYDAKGGLFEEGGRSKRPL